jgi:hypothetical protein
MVRRNLEMNICTHTLVDVPSTSHTPIDLTDRRVLDLGEPSERTVPSNS